MPAARPLGGQALIRRVREHGPERVYLAWGRERWFVERALALLKRALFSGPGGDTSRAMNYDAFSGRETKAAALLTACRTVPMFADWRFVLVREAAKVGADDWKELGGYLEDPSDNTCLFIDWGARKPDGRLRWVKSARKHGVLADCRPLYDREVPDFLAFAVRNRKLSIDRDGAAYLGEVVGTDLNALEDAVERLSLFIGDRERIGLEDVETCIADTRAHEVWDLTDAVGDRDLPRALRILERVRQQGAAAPQLLASLHRTIRQLWQAREVMATDQSRGALAQALGLPPFVAGKVATAARRYDTALLATAIRALAAAEVETRTGGMRAAVKEWAVLEGLMTALCLARRR